MPAKLELLECESDFTLVPVNSGEYLLSHGEAR